MVITLISCASRNMQQTSDVPGQRRLVLSCSLSQSSVGSAFALRAALEELYIPHLAFYNVPSLSLVCSNSHQVFC